MLFLKKNTKKEEKGKIEQADIELSLHSYVKVSDPGVI